MTACKPREAGQRMEARVYDSFIYRQIHLKTIYVFAAVAFVSYPLGTYLYIKHNLHSYNLLFALASLFFAFALFFYIRLTKGKLVIDGDRLLYEKTTLQFPRFITEQGPIHVDIIKKIELIKDRYGNHTFTLTLSDGRSLYFMAPSKDAAGFVNWLNAKYKDNISEKGHSEKCSYKIGFIIIGMILLDVALVFAAIYFAT
jgi:hypothetical protein